MLSRVVLAVTEEEDAKGRLNPVIANFLDGKLVSSYNNQGAIFYSWRNIKWEDDNPNIRAINKWLGDLDDEHEDGEPPYQLVMVNETKRGNVDFGICIRFVIDY